MASSHTRMPRDTKSPFVHAYVVKGNGDLVECGARGEAMNAWKPSPVEGADMELGCVGVVRDVLDEVR